MSESEKYFERSVWAHSYSHDPVVMLYELNKINNCVTRTVNIYADGRIVREALGDDPRARTDAPCLCDGHFKPQVSDPSERIFSFETNAAEFEDAFARAQPKTFEPTEKTELPC